MLYLSSNELKNLQLTPNRVLVKLVDKQSSSQTENNNIFLVDKQFSEEKHASVTGIIVNQCTELDHTEAEWHTTIETKINDYVVFTYTASIYCKDPLKGRSFNDENHDEYLMIDYQDIISLKRGETIMPINGFILVEPVLENHKSLFGISGLKSMRFGRVYLTGQPISQYLFAGKPRTDVWDGCTNLKSGDIIMFSRFSDIPLEYDSHASILGNKQFYRMQRRDIFAVLDHSKLSDVEIMVA